MSFQEVTTEHSVFFEYLLCAWLLCDIYVMSAPLRLFLIFR